MNNQTTTPPLAKTPAQQQREQLHKTICSRYQTLKSTYPDATDTRLFTTIAYEVRRTMQNVRDILIDNQLYFPKTK